MDNINNDDIEKYKSQIEDKKIKNELIKGESDDNEYEKHLSILILFIIGVSLLFNTLVPMFAVFFNILL